MAVSWNRMLPSLLGAGGMVLAAGCVWSGAPAPLSVGALAVGLAGLALTVRSARRAASEAERLSSSMTVLQGRLAELEALAQRQKDFSDTIADWFWESDSEQRFVWISDEFEAVLGVPIAKMVGKRRWDVVSERMEIDSDQWRDHIADLTAHRPFRDFKYWLEAADGRPRWVKVSGMPRYNPDGSFAGYRGTGTNITDAVESAHRMHMLTRAVEQSPVSIVITDLNARIQYVNSEFVKVTGYTVGEVLGCNPRILQSGQTPPETFEAMWEALSAEEKWEGELINRRKDGALYWELASIQPIQNLEGVVTNYLAIKTDITQQKQNEARLAALVEELHRSNTELEQFAYVASHDLRQPLRMISGYLGMLRRAFADQLNDDTSAFFDFATNGAKRLDQMIVELLEYSRIGRQDEPLGPVDLDDALGEAARNLEFAVTDAKARLDLATGLPTVMGNRSELVRLFQNLMGNALKYSQPDRPPVVAVQARQTLKDDIISVSDNGIGIAENDLQRVFGIFQRLVTREKVEGTGIGLAICRKIAERHGGRIWVESTLGQGSTFHVAFPRKTE